MAGGIPAFIIAGTRSGCGKTTVSLGIMAALVRRGLVVQPYKCGPDFIDPTLHREICGRMSRNLDLRMCGPEWTRECFHRNLAGADAAVVEGVMGMFDGGAGSAAALAKHLSIPVLLVVEVNSQAESAAAVIKGFTELDPEVKIAGVVLNRIASETHLRLVREAVGKHCRAEILGAIPANAGLAMPSRHLGLHLGPEQRLDQEWQEKAAALIEENIDIDRLLANNGGQIFNLDKKKTVKIKDLTPKHGKRKKIAVARDRAFCFYYQDNLDLLAANGAELCFFSPLRDRDLPPGCEALYLGGGYPELYAAELAANRAMRGAVRRFCEHGGLCLAECGGFMYLCESITTLDGKTHEMAGVFPAGARMKRRLAALGYREARLTRDCFLGRAGERLRGHEFHYSETGPMPDTVDRVFDLGQRREGYRVKNTLAGYVHLHFGSNPGAARWFKNGKHG